MSISGGNRPESTWRALLLQRTDILLMDEPTNHLDMKSVEWLEEYLDNFKGTVLVISHDRYFLDRVADGIIELEDGKIEVFKAITPITRRKRKDALRRGLKPMKKIQKSLNN
jgi:ATP-binding cassette subfamily F protein 3